MLKGKTQIIIILGLILVIAFLLTREETVKTVTKVEFIPTIEQKFNTKPVEVKMHTIKVPIQIPNDTIRDTIYKDISTKKYSFKDTLPNGVIESTILADNIYKRDVKLTTFDKHTTTTNTIVKSNLFLGATVSSMNKTQINQASLNLYYVHKDKFIVGAGTGYDFISNQPITNFTLAIKF